MTTHEPNRQVSDSEQALWSEVKVANKTQDGQMLRFVAIGSNQCGLHAERARQLVSTWENEGLVAGTDTGYNTGFLTEYGTQVDSIESDMVSGESWR
jgi:hypothetical protein